MRRSIEPLPQYKAQDAVNFFAMKPENETEREDGLADVASPETRRPNAEQKAFSSKIMLANADYLYMMCPKLEGYALNTNLWGKSLAMQAFDASD